MKTQQRTARGVRLSSLIEIAASPRGAASLCLDLFVLSILFAAVCGPFLAHAHRTALPGGWDGVPHYAIADLYARKYFPAISGWVPEYFAGMPYPNFYPPTFYFLVALLTKLGLSTHSAFMGLQSIASLAVPLLTYGVARRVAGSRIAGLVAGGVSTGLMVDHNPLWRMGITLPSTFDAGLSTQLLGHVMLLLFLFCLLGAEVRRLEALLAGATFALVPLTNVHMVWSAAFMFIAFAIARIAGAKERAARISRVRLYALVGASGVALSAPWVLPMIAGLDFVPTQALPPPSPGVIAHAFWRPGAYLLLSMVAALARRNAWMLSLAAGLLLLLGFTVLPTATWLGLGHLALQPTRVVIPFPFLATCSIGYLVSVAGDVLARPHARVAVGAAVLGVFYWHFHIETRSEANLSPAHVEGYENVLRALDGRSDGRVLVEMGVDGMSDGFALQSLVGARGAGSLTTVFRESSINVFFAVPLRNSLSHSVESFGIDHKVTTDELRDGPIDEQQRRLDLFNVRYFAVQSAEARSRVGRLPGVHRLSQAGRWELWGYDAPGPGYASVPSFAPVLTFASYTVKPRPEYGFDFVRLGEEMFSSGRLDVPLARSSCSTIDGCADLARFEALLLIDYPCDDCARAREEVRRFAEHKPVILLESESALYRELRGTLGEGQNLRWIGRTLPGAPDTATQRAAARETIGWILDAIEAVKTPLTGAPRVADARLDGITTHVTLDRDPERPVPVWIRQGYFPSWRGPEGGGVYLATPTFQLTFLDQREAALRFSPTPLERCAQAVGLLGVALLVWLSRRRATEPQHQHRSVEGAPEGTPPALDGITS